MQPASTHHCHVCVGGDSSRVCWWRLLSCVQVATTFVAAGVDINRPQLHTGGEFCHISAPGCTLAEVEAIVARVNQHLERLGVAVTVRSPHLCPLPTCPEHFEFSSPAAQERVLQCAHGRCAQPMQKNMAVGAAPGQGVHRFHVLTPAK